MSDYDNNMRGVLFPEDKQKLAENEKHPYAKGSIEIAGVKVNLSAWVVVSKNGRKFFSIKAEYPQNDSRRLQCVMPAEMPRDESLHPSPQKNEADEEDLPF